MKWISTLCITAVLAVAGAAGAYPTLTGPTGLAVLPTANFAGGIIATADYQKLYEGFAVPIRVTISTGKTCEIGAISTFLSSSSSLDKAYGANAKFRLTSNEHSNTAIGVQLLRLRDDWGTKTDYEQAYLVWTGNYSTVDFPAFDIILGVNWTCVSPGDEDAANALRVFAGAEVGITRYVTLTAEFQSEKSEVGDTDPLTTAALRYHSGGTWSAQIGLTNAFGLVATADHFVFGGIAVNLGGGSVCSLPGYRKEKHEDTFDE
ncbi:MAG: hypothetical protein ACYDBB_18045 [Armatimonadota bacterium]